MKKNNLEITLLKIYFTFAVLFFHSYKVTEKPIDYLFPRGYLAVEFFFIISGFFMASSIVRNKERNQELSNFGFIIHKIKPIYPHLIVAFIINFLAWVLIIKQYSFAHFALLSVFSIGELSFLSFSGIKFTYHFFNGPTWYLSSMILAIFALYPFVKKDVKRFGSYAAPLIAITIYAYISQNFKCVCYVNEFIYITSIGTLRALAAISLGIMAYTIIDNFKANKKQLTKQANTIIRILCCVLFILLTTMLTIKTFSKPLIATDMCFISYFLIFFVLLQVSTGSISFLDNKLTRFLATLSLPLYLNHRVWLHLLCTKYEYLNQDTKLLIYFSASFLTALISIPIAKLVDNGFKKLGNIIFEDKKA